MGAVAGIDASTTATGVAVLERHPENDIITFSRVFVPSPVKYSSARGLSMTAKKALHAKEKREFAWSRVLFMMEHIESVLDEYRPSKIVMEDIYDAKRDIMTTKMLGRIQGCVIDWSRRNEVPCLLKYPSTWRKETGIKLTEDHQALGRDALKILAKEKVRELFGVDVTDDEADAILIALSGL